MEFYSPLDDHEIKAIKKHFVEVSVDRNPSTPPDHWNVWGEVNGGYDQIGTLTTADVDRIYHAGVDVENHEAGDGSWEPQRAS